MLFAIHHSKWFAHYPIHDVKAIPFMVEMLTENIRCGGGNINTAVWVCSDRFIDYGYYHLTVTYEKFIPERVIDYSKFGLI